MHRDLPIRICWFSAWLLLAWPLVVRLTALHGASASGLRNFVDFFYDDGYYYLSIAANVAEAGRSSYDGITATNGYQPLWLLVLSGLARLVGTQTRVFFVASSALIYAIACATPLQAAIWRRNPTLLKPALCLAAGLAVIIIQQAVVFLQGLEAILFAPLVLPLVMLIEKEQTDSRTLRWLSVTLAIAVLVRLDSIALFVALILCLPVFEILSAQLRPRDAARRAFNVALRLSIIFVPVLLLYLAINQWLFGSPVPVSGLAKLIGGARFGNWGATALFFRSIKSFAVLIAILGVLEIIAHRVRRPGALFYRSMAVVCVAIAIQIFYYGAFSSWYLWPWYTYLVAVFMALLIARIIYLCSLLFAERRVRIVATAALVVIGLASVKQSVAFALSALSPGTQAALRWLVPTPANNGPASGISFNQANLDMLDEFFPSSRHTLIAMGDRAGGLGYWGRTKLSIVQTEGLVLDANYLKARAANAGEAYLEQFPIQYLVVDREILPQVVAPDGHMQFVIPEPIQGRIVKSSVPIFCFPLGAIRYQKSYRSDYGTNLRVAFSFADREPCSERAVARVQSIEQGIGLRQYSLPSEYNLAAGGVLSKKSEDRDRHYDGTTAIQ